MEDGERGPWKGPGADAVPSPKTWAQTDALPSQAVPREGGGLWGLDTLQEESTQDLPSPPSFPEGALGRGCPCFLRVPVGKGCKPRWEAEGTWEVAAQWEMGAGKCDPLEGESMRGGLCGKGLVHCRPAQGPVALTPFTLRSEPLLKADQAYSDSNPNLPPPPCAHTHARAHTHECAHTCTNACTHADTRT